MLGLGQLSCLLCSLLYAAAGPTAAFIGAGARSPVRLGRRSPATTTRRHAGFGPPGAPKKAKAARKLTKKERSAQAAQSSRAPAAAPPAGTATPATFEKHLPIDCAYPGLRLVHADPPVCVVDDFFTADECAEMIAASADGYSVASATFAAATSDHRRSATWYLHYDRAMALLRKTHALTGSQVPCFEEPQIVRYEMGDRFGQHEDAIPRSLLENGNQRVATLLVYLNDVGVGGRTSFPELGVRVAPKAGRALLFFPAFADGTPDPRTTHQAEVAMDEKWIAQCWVHQKDYDPKVPPGNSHGPALELMA